MVIRRCLWLVIWIASLVFLAFYQQWLAWLLLGAVLLVPLFSLVVSLPGMLTAVAQLQVPERVTVSTPVVPQLVCSNYLVIPLWSYRLQVTQAMTGKRYRLRPGNALPTEHCGALICRVRRAKVYDYLGLFSLPLRCQKEFQVLVEPQPLPIPNQADADADAAFAWKPKNGGFSENHELRLYAPGDSLRQIHWKLSAKTGKLILREPMVPDPGRVLVRLVLKGDPEEIDRLLGRFTWLSQRLLEQSIPFELLCLTGSGIHNLPVRNSKEQEQTLDFLLGQPLTPTGDLPVQWENASMQYDLGGEPDES